MAILDSGERRQFDSGAVRDISEGKGRCDLLPLDVVGKVLYNDSVLPYINTYIRKGDLSQLLYAIQTFAEDEYGSISEAMLEVAIHYEDGAKKYAERNWEMGILLHCYIDSGVRHYLKYLRGDGDERHDRAFLWNMLGAIWTHIHHPELIDLPFAKENNK